MIDSKPERAVESCGFNHEENMIRTALTFLAIVTGLAPSFLSADTSQFLSTRAYRAQLSLEGINEVIEQALVDYQVPGLAMAVVVDGQVILAKGYGYRDMEKKLPVSADTLFLVGSPTKAFTSFVAGTLVDQGQIGWDEPVSNYFPDFRLFDPYMTQNLTLRDLLTHRTGMPRHEWMWFNSTFTRQEVLHRLRFLEPAFDIRERYHYNNLMYLTAGMALEKVTGKSWETLVQEKILNPLGMNSTYFSVNEMLEASSNYAYPHIEVDGQLRRLKHREISLIGPAGSLCSNVLDIGQWLKLQLNHGNWGGKQLISQATLQEIHTPQVIISGYPEQQEAILNAYGLGWAIQSYRGHYNVLHDGGPEGMTTIAAILPYDNIGVVVFANKNLNPISHCLTLHVIDRILELPPIDWIAQGVEAVQRGRISVQENQIREDLSRKKGTRPSHPLEDFVGKYSHPGYGDILLEEKNGKLQMEFHGITSVLDHWHYDVFVISSQSEDIILSHKGLKLTFRTALSGEIEELSIPFEPKSAEILFKRVPDEKHSPRAYLAKFAGTYEVYNYNIDIAVKGRSLVVNIPGQPMFELIPSGENEFTIPSMPGATVRFLFDDQDEIEEVLLIQPYGAFSAKPTKRG